MARIILNGDSRVVNASCISDLVKELKLSEHGVAVEKNKEIVPKSLHQQAEINEGDIVEIVQCVSGG